MDNGMSDIDALELARAVRRNRERRKETAREANQALAKLRPGESAAFPVPKDDPARRDTYLAINAVAYGKLGGGRYALRMPKGATVITVSCRAC